MSELNFTISADSSKLVAACRTGGAEIKAMSAKATDAIDRDLKALTESGAKMTAQEKAAYAKFLDEKQALLQKAFAEERALRAKNEKAMEASIKASLEIREKAEAARSAHAAQTLKDIKAMDAAEKNAAATKGIMMLQRAAQIGGLMQQVKAAGESIDGAMMIAADSSLETGDRLKAMGEAGVMAATTIGQAWAAGGPIAAIAATAMIAKDGLTALFTDAAAGVEAYMEKSVAQVAEAQARIDAITGRNQPADPSIARRDAGSAKDRTVRTVDREEAGAVSQVQRDAANRSLDAANLPAKEKAAATAANEEKTALALDAIAANAHARRMAAEAAYQKSISESLAKRQAEVEQMTRAAENLTARLPFDKDGSAAKSLDGKLKEMQRVKSEMDTLRDELGKSGQRSIGMRDAESARQTNSQGDLNLIRRRGAAASQTAQLAQDKLDREKQERDKDDGAWQGPLRPGQREPGMDLLPPPVSGREKPRGGVEGPSHPASPGPVPAGSGPVPAMPTAADARKFRQDKRDARANQTTITGAGFGGAMAQLRAKRMGLDPSQLAQTVTNRTSQNKAAKEERAAQQKDAKAGAATEAVIKLLPRLAEDIAELKRKFNINPV